MALSKLDSVTIDRCAPAAEKTVLAQAAQAWHEAERAAYWQSIAALTANGQSDRVVLLAARNQEGLLAAQIAQSLPGRTAAVWPPQFVALNDEIRDQISAAMFARLMGELQASGAHLAQALVNENDSASASLFALGGFSHAADLLYMAADVNGAAQPKLMFELEPFRPAANQRLVNLIERTYVGTLDCPRLDHLRNTADVVAGYQAVGTFQPELWLIARHEGSDIGCLLLNLHPDVQHAEIVYVALVPEVRGRRWGSLLARHALWLARQTDSQRVVLAVDAANQPAIHMYKEIGFQIFDCRAVWIRPLV